MVSSNVYTELVARLNYTGSERLLRILRKLVTPEEGRLLLELPAEPEELAQKLALDEENVRLKLREFMERGLVIPTSKGYCFARDMTQLHDSTLSSGEKWIDTEILDMWKDFRKPNEFREWQAALGIHIYRSSRSSPHGLRLNGALIAQPMIFYPKRISES